MSQSHDSDSGYVPFDKQSFTPAQTADILGVCESTLFELLKTGALRSFKVGRARRITGAAIDSFRAEG
ncbi:helix-turn-helix domain-containing protein [Tardiphaga sp. 804_B3_N1_9]|uniref:helix-turn-helix domain-containing protein n=1 Tax=Tardiphaga sp. 804_B3_N1_9 TaxID=3240786 RepID=UPI003F21A7A8